MSKKIIEKDKNVILELSIESGEMERNGVRKEFQDCVCFKVIAPDNFDFDDEKFRLSCDQEALPELENFFENPDKYENQILLDTIVNKNGDGIQDVHVISVIENVICMAEISNPFAKIP